MTQSQTPEAGVPYLTARCPRCRHELMMASGREARSFKSSNVELACVGCGKKSRAKSWQWGQTQEVNPGYGPKVESALIVETYREEDGSIFLRGEAMALHGISGLAKGQVLITFSPENIELTVLSTGKASSIEYASVTSLQFAGRGEHEVSSNFQIVGGGFGLGGAAKGILEAEITNAVIQSLTRRKVIETLVGLAWDSGSLLLRTDRHTPEFLAARCAEVVERIEAAQLPRAGAASFPASGSLSQQLRELGELRDAGVLSEDEFAAAKAKLLN